MTREEKIQLYRGIIQTLGLMILVISMVWMIKNFNERGRMIECGYEYPNGTIIKTGLYGNCGMIDVIANQLPYLQKIHYVNSNTTEEVLNVQTTN